MDRITLSLPNKPEYVTIARLTASVIANNIGFDVEDIEDIKLAVGEACNNAVLHGGAYDEFTLTFSVAEDEMEIQVTDQGNGFNVEEYHKPTLEEYDGNGLGIFIMNSLMDDVKIETGLGKGTVITLKKSL